MKIIKSNVAPDDIELAYSILSKLRMGDRVFGAPAEGLKHTLKHLEEHKPKEDSYDSTAYNLSDKEYDTEVAKLKKGIKGEETLAEYFEKLVRLDDKLSDLIIFSSLGQEKEGLDYIPDTDFLCVYGCDLMCVDAKAVNTKPEVDVYVSGDGIYAGKKEEPIVEVNSQATYWRKELSHNKNLGTVNGCVCIINRAGATILRNDDWKYSDIKPVHISELQDFLTDWIKEKTPEVDLSLLVDIAKEQIKQQDSGFNLEKAKRMLHV